MEQEAQTLALHQRKGIPTGFEAFLPLAPVEHIPAAPGEKGAAAGVAVAGSGVSAGVAAVLDSAFAVRFPMPGSTVTEPSLRTAAEAEAGVAAVTLPRDRLATTVLFNGFAVGQHTVVGQQKVLHKENLVLQGIYTGTED